MCAASRKRRHAGRWYCVDDGIRQNLMLKRRGEQKKKEPDAGGERRREGAYMRGKSGGVARAGMGHKKWCSYSMMIVK